MPPPLGELEEGMQPRGGIAALGSSRAGGPGAREVTAGEKMPSADPTLTPGAGLE